MNSELYMYPKNEQISIGIDASLEKITSFGEILLKVSYYNKGISISTHELVGQRQAIGILGMIFAVLGGVAWFLRQNIVAIMLWGVAGLIILKLNKRVRTRRR